MSARATQSLFLDGDSRIHRLPPQCKVAAAVLFILAVVVTPREAFWAFGCYALILVVIARLGHVPARYALRRLTIELPFVAFAFLLPVIAGGDRTDVLGASLSTDGLWAAWNILAKATLGVATSVILAATTPVAEILHGLDRLHLPKAITMIAGFMVRYADVVSDEMRRMRIARMSRGYDPRWFWQAKAVATSAGALFLRSYERGERVHLAMLSRGFTGTMPVLGHPAATRHEWLSALAVPLLMLAIATTALLAPS